MHGAIDIFERFLINDEWSYQKKEHDDGRTCSFKMLIKGKHCQFTTHVVIDEELNQVLIYSVCPNPIEEARRLEIMEYLTRANYGLLIGNFEMDITDGEVRFKTSLRSDDQIGESTMKSLFMVNLMMHDKYYKGIMSIIYGMSTPKMAIDLVET